MKLDRRFSSVFLSGLISFCLGCSIQKSDSDALRVNNAVTPVKDQGESEFCWAYAIASLIESELKAREGIEISISPEAIASIRLIESFRGLYKFALDSQKEGKTRAEVKAEIGKKFSSFDDVSGTFLGITNTGEIKQVSTVVRALNIIEKYGLIPESVWREKFSSAKEMQIKIFGMQQGFFKLFDKYESTLPGEEEILKEVVYSGFKKPIPFDGFEYKGRKYNSKEFATEIMGFKSDNYTSIKVTKHNMIPDILQKIVASLKAGHNVVMGIRLDNSLLQNSAYVANETQKAIADYNHAVLVTDFKNKENMELEYFVAKDSYRLENANFMGKFGYIMFDSGYLFSQFGNSAYFREPSITEIILPKIFSK